MKFFLVGGFLRDRELGIKSKDVDFAVEASSFDAMVERLEADGFEIFISNPEFVTVRAKVPKGNPLEKHTRVADFVLCRKDGPSSDGRRPNFVEAGTILDDLARRDFTVNSFAEDEDGNILDPHGGLIDLKNRLLRFTGNPMDRIMEDGLRVMRAYRFAVCKEFALEKETAEALCSELAMEMLANITIERIRPELNLMLHSDTIRTLDILGGNLPLTVPVHGLFKETIFRDGLRLEATSKK